jgi:hypothetical protein
MIEKQVATVYYSPAAKRRFLTKRAAIHKETLAIIRKKYPSAPFEPDTGDSFTCEEMEEFPKMYRRLSRIVARSII